MWSEADRQKYERRGLRYPSDLTDSEWSLIEPHIPLARRGGRRREVDVREVLQGVLYLMETGCQWRHLPRDFPPRSTLSGDISTSGATTARSTAFMRRFTSHYARRRAGKLRRPQALSTAER